MTIKNWWDNLVERERRLLSIGGAVVGLFCIYALVWSPLSGVVTDAKMRIESQYQLLGYLHRASQTIAAYQSQGIQANAANDADLLSLAESTLAEAQLSQQLKQVQQTDQTHIALTFEKVPFDKLMTWLQLIAAQHNVHVKSFTATKLETAGLVDASITLG